MEADRLSVWLTIPSAKPPEAAQVCVDVWKSCGYMVALWRDGDDDVSADLKLVGQYPGYALACNTLIRHLIDHEVAAEWFICAGDDILPDSRMMADDIAEQCRQQFGGTFGVMQPTGDRWAEVNGSAQVDRVAISAWYGRDYCRETYGGNGPLWPEYWHMFVDEEAQAVAQGLGVYWQRRDLTQFHDHWIRASRPMPPYLATANSRQHWDAAQALFNRRRAAGFPGHEPIGVAA